MQYISLKHMIYFSSLFFSADASTAIITGQSQPDHSGTHALAVNKAEGFFSDNSEKI